MKFTAYTDGACRISNPGLCACGFVVYADEMEHHRSARVLDGLNTNNISEYTGLIDLLVWAEENKITGIEIKSDSMLVVMQTNGLWRVRPELLDICSRAFVLLNSGDHTLQHVKGHAGNAGNEAVDQLCNETLDKFQGKTPKKGRKHEK